MNRDFETSSLSIKKIDDFDTHIISPEHLRKTIVWRHNMAAFNSPEGSLAELN